MEPKIVYFQLMGILLKDYSTFWVILIIITFLY